MTFQTLPSELHLAIASQLTPKGLASLIQTNHQFSNLLQPELDERILQSDNGNAALQHALYRDRPEILQSLMDHGRALALELASWQNDRKQNLLHLAAQHGSIHVVEQLLDLSKTAGMEAEIQQQAHSRNDDDHDSGDNDEDAVGTFGLMFWRQYNREEGGEESEYDSSDYDLNDAGYASLEDRTGRTPLHLAAKHGHVPVVRFLLDKAAVNIDRITHPRKRENQSMETDRRRLLIQKDFLPGNCDISGRGGETALHEACYCGHLEVVKALVEKGADVNICSKDMWAPLHAASFGGHLQVIQYLLEKGARMSSMKDLAEKEVPRVEYTSLKDLRNRKLVELDLAVLARHNEVVKLILDYYKDLKSVDGHLLLAAVRSGYEDILATLLARFQGDINDSFGQSEQGCLMIFAAWQGEPSIAKLLLEYGADVNLKNLDGEGLMHFAARSGSVEVMKLLLDAGVDPMEEPEPMWEGCPKGKSPLMVAARCGKVEAARFLLENGATLEGEMGGKVIEEAVDGYQKAMVNFLEERGVSVPDNWIRMMKEEEEEEDDDEDVEEWLQRIRR